MKQISIIIPTYNEAKNLPPLVEELLASVPRELADVEIIFVDDNSPDGTGQVAEELAKKWPIKVVHRAGKLGLGSAVRAGFAVSTRPIVGVMDADLSHDPNILPTLIRALDTSDIAIGSRFVPGSQVNKWIWWRKLLSEVGVCLTKCLTGVRDPLSGYFFMKRSVIEGVSLTTTGYKILFEILVKGKYKNVAEFPFQFRMRTYSSSKLNWKEHWLFLKQMAAYSTYKFIFFVKNVLTKIPAKIISIIFSIVPTGFLIKLYTFLCTKKHLMVFINRMLFKIIPESVSVAEGTLYLNKSDPVVSGMLAFGAYEAMETKILREKIKPGMVVVDVGANIGYFTLLAASRVGKSGKVLSFEPESENFSILKKNIEKNGLINVIPFQMALGDSDGQAQLYLSEENKGDHRIYQDNTEKRKSVCVEIIRFDTVMERLALNHVDVIKIDVQGAENSVMRGMNAVIEKSPQLLIIIEFWPYGLKQAGVDPLGFLSELSEKFLLSDIDEGKNKIIPVSDINELLQKYHGKKYTNLICEKNSLCPPL